MKNRRPMVAPGWISMPVSEPGGLRQQSGEAAQRRPRPQSVRHPVRPDGVQAGIDQGVLEVSARRRVVVRARCEVFAQRDEHASCVAIIP